MEAYMISWKIYMIIEFFFDIVDLLKQMKIYQYSNVMLYWLLLIIVEQWGAQVLLSINWKISKCWSIYFWNIHVLKSLNTNDNQSC
jgi:hypothetical protein